MTDASMPSGRAPDGPTRPTRPAIPEEAKVFIRTASFGVVVGAGYGVLTGEPAGAVLLLAFGLASAVAAIAIIVGSHTARAATPTSAAGDGPVGGVSEDAREPVPRPGWAPLIIGIGLGGLALGAAFGPWLGIAGLLAALAGSKAWLDATNREADEARRRRPPVGDAGDDPA